MKKFLMVVMAMLLSLSMVAGCGGDKKAELLKGLKTEIGTMLGNVDKLASVAELKGEDAKNWGGQFGPRFRNLSMRVATAN